MHSLLPLATIQFFATQLPVTLCACDVFADVKDAVLPATTDKTLSNFFGYQALGWGLAGVVFPTQMMVSLFGATPSPTGLVLMRGMSITNLCLGSKICKGTDEEAAATGFLFLAAWTYIVNKFLAAGVIGAFSAPIMTFNAIGALVAARRSGGLFKTVTELDTDALSNLLPRAPPSSARHGNRWRAQWLLRTRLTHKQRHTRFAGDQEMSTRNLVGVQLLSWGIISTFFSSVLFGPMLLGCGDARSRTPAPAVHRRANAHRLRYPCLVAVQPSML